MKAENIYLHEYFNLTGDLKDYYDFLIKFDESFLKPLNFFDIKKMRDFSFYQVKEFQKSFIKGISWVEMINFMSDFANVKKDTILKTRLLEICNFKNHLVSEIELINKIEAIELGHEKTQREEAAGIDNLLIFGYYTQVIELANNDITKIDTIGKMKYEDCFVELSYRKRSAEYKEKFLKIKDNG